MRYLIDRQAAIDETWKEPTYTDPLNVLTEVRDRIKALPSAQFPVDAVPVIRCKDCKHWQYESCFVESEEGDAESIILDRFAFDFCSRAERRKDETN